MIDDWGISGEIALRWILLDLIDDKLTIASWLYQAVTGANVDPDLFVILVIGSTEEFCGS